LPYAVLPQREQFFLDGFLSRVAWQFRYREYFSRAFKTGEIFAATGLNFCNACSVKHKGHIGRRYLP